MMESHFSLFQVDEALRRPGEPDEQLPEAVHHRPQDGHQDVRRLRRDREEGAAEDEVREIHESQVINRSRPFN